MPDEPIPSPSNRLAKGAAGIAAGIVLAAVLIPHWEGEDLTAVHNSFDPAGINTVCDGVTNYDWAWLKVGMKFTVEECRAALVALIPKYVAPLTKCIPDLDKMPPHRIAALIDASYNLGPKTVCGSTAVRLIKAGDIKNGCQALGLFVRANGSWLRGLFNRRNDTTWGEIAWCNRED